MDTVDCIVVGAGVVGLACARKLAESGLETIILERAGAYGTETSSRNSEVVHAGIYYPTGSLKARLCVTGRAQLYDYAVRKGVPHHRCGKLIVATSAAQDAGLAAIAERAAACGVTDLSLLDRAEAQRMEPALNCTSALLSPSTGIIDSHALMRALLGDAEAAGAVLSLNSEVTGGQIREGLFVLRTRDTQTGEDFTLAARHLVNAAGLWASGVAASLDGLPARHVPQTRFARGSYFAVPGRAAFSRLIYPVPEPGGLGVHLTLDLGGNMRFGPDVEWIDSIDYRTSDARRDHFVTEIRKYWPALPADALAPTYCGIRPKLSGPGEPAADFSIQGPAQHGVAGLINLFGIESPGLTASLAIADEVARGLAR
ncbi:NAD(P)/FAD-dependent oxidoreductase [Phaeovulum sp.]|uniref:NAD(P)/FAD-dependent oxidoreductase n=1 Tax=Phaeovulum sp. TaxID=2934796 RepID=UPI0039E5824D